MTSIYACGGPTLIKTQRLCFLADNLLIVRNITCTWCQSHVFDFSENLISEVRSFATEFKEEIGKAKSIIDLLQLLYDYKLISSFPQLQKLLILLLTIPVTVASAERSFSKLKLIKSYLRSKMQQSRLTNLAILSIENKLAKTLDTSELIKKFASVNATHKRKC